MHARQGAQWPRTSAPEGRIFSGMELAAVLGFAAIAFTLYLLYLGVRTLRSSEGLPTAEQGTIAALGGLYILATAIVYFPLGFLAGRVLAARPGIAQITTRVAGIAMIVVALLLLAEKTLPVLLG